MRNALLLSVAASSLLLAASSGNAAGTWVPAVPASGSTSFTVFGINDTNNITGSYIDSSGNYQGFVGPFNGSGYTTFTDGGTETEPRAINNHGDTTGYDVSALNEWERTSDGTLTNITMNGTGLTGTAQGINREGKFVANYTNSSGVETGYEGANAVYLKDIKLKIMNGGYAGRAINSNGHIGGWYYDSSSIQHGFVKILGTTIHVDYPGAIYTVVEGLNDKGKLSGQWEDTSGVIHGFIYDIKANKYIPLDAPGASFTQVWGINNHDVVAASADVSGVIESFVYCMHTANCPSGGAAVVRPKQRPTGKVKPEAQ